MNWNFAGDKLMASNKDYLEYILDQLSDEVKRDSEDLE